MPRARRQVSQRCYCDGSTEGYPFNAVGLHTNKVRRPPYEVSWATMHEQGALLGAYRSSSDPLKAATNMTLHDHGVRPQMVDHIEAEKAAGATTLTE